MTAERDTATGQEAREPATLWRVMDELESRGFSEHFTVVQGQLRGVDHGRTFPAEQVAVCEYYRFEGISDPDDMAILYALETRSGCRGTLADAFGVYADPLVGAFMSHVPPNRVGFTPSRSAASPSDCSSTPSSR